MLNRILTGALLVAILIALLVQPIRAGGWTVVTLDQLPTEVRAGEPITLGFQVLQHGNHPLVLEPDVAIVLARHSASGETLSFVAQPDAEAGHYTVELVMPYDGTWTWEVRPGGFPPAVMPELAVAPGVVPSAVQQPAPDLQEWWQWVLTLLRPQPAIAAPVEVSLVTDQAAYGKALFVAKGCVTCHLHSEVSTQFTVELGPNLTDYNVIPEYVETWLKDPKAIKPQTQMPQLPLSKIEIDALIAFLSEG